MAKKSGGQIAGDLAHLAKALYDIIKAFMQGGWGAAALQLLKHYWPQILAIAVALTLIPIIVFCCLPMFLFGYESSTDTEISAMTAQADTVSAYYDLYDTYIDEWVEQIKTDVTESGEQNTETSGTTDSTEPEVVYEYEVVILGEKIQKNWFVALHAVTIGNDLNAANEADIRSFAGKCVDYTLTQVEEDTETEAEGTEPAGDDTDPRSSTVDSTEPTEESTDPTESTEPPEPVVIKMLLEIKHRTPIEIMAACGYTQTDENWARLMYKTLEGGHNSAVGVLGSIFEDSNWRNHISSDYGPRTNPYVGFHKGIDIGMPMGTPICATKDGTVSTSVCGNGSYGYYIILDHGDGIQTLYAHCSELLVSVGDVVTKGQVIAKVGSTGNSTGPHVHFEVRINGERVDPLPYLP